MQKVLKNKTRGRGFTLLELVVSMAVVAILVAVGIPNMRSFLLNNKRTSVVNDLVAAMTLARTEAQKQNRVAVVCPLQGTSCVPSGANWSNGWLIYVNMDTANPPVFDGADQVIKIFPLATDESLTAIGNVGAFIFRVSPGRNTAGTVTICDSRGSAHGRQVIVAASGRIRTSEQVTACI